MAATDLGFLATKVHLGDETGGTAARKVGGEFGFVGRRGARKGGVGRVSGERGGGGGGGGGRAWIGSCITMWYL